MKRYRRQRTCLFLFLVAYLVLGQASHWAPVKWMPHREVFPFFSWYLFVDVPGDRTDFGLRIHESGEQSFDPPVYFEDAEGVVSQPHSIAAHVVVLRLGKAIEAQDDATVEELRGLLEKRYLPERVRYGIVKRRFDPLERWKTGALTATPVALFTRTGKTP